MRNVEMLLRRTVLGSMFFVACCGLPSCLFSHDDVFTSEGLLVSSGDNLKSTVIVPDLGATIPAGKNVVWCGTFQLAWNETCKLVGEDLHLTDEPPAVAEMNLKKFAAKDLDFPSYVALAGFVRDGIYEKIELALAAKFGGQARPKYLPPKQLTPRPQDIVAYSYLFKHLEFAIPFERASDPMDFQGNGVSAFGVVGYKEQHRTMYGQVTIFDYLSKDDFVIELKTTSAGDRLILAKTSPAGTLEKTVQKVLARASGGGTAMETGDQLQVPKFNFDLTRDYIEFTGRGLLVKNPAVAKDLLLLSAIQNIRFQMDEKGVRLRSEAHMSFGCSAGEPFPQHIMIFDKPFLMLLMRNGAAVPYFAVWVNNPELLVKG